MVREIRKSDKQEVLRISSHIWEGDDYVPNVFDKWITDSKNLFVGYWESGKLIGFGRMRFLTEKDIWLEALRKDPQTSVKGVGYKIAQYYLDKLKSKKINSIRFSTYFGNIASIKLNEKLGFEKILTLSLKNIPKKNLTKPSVKINTEISFDEFYEYISQSNYLKGTNNFIGKGWVIHEFSKEFLKEFYEKNRFSIYILNNKIMGAVLFSEVEYMNVFWVSFIEAQSKEVFSELITQVGYLAQESSELQILLPADQNLRKYAADIGFESWEQDNDFLLYEMPIEKLK